MNQIIICIIVFIFTSCTNQKFTSSSETSIYSQKADLYNFDSNLAKAIEYYEKDYLYNRNNISALKLARIYRYKIKDYIKMEEWYINAHKLHNDFAFYELGIFFYLKGNMNKTIEYFDKNSLNDSLGMRATLTKLKYYTNLSIKYYEHKNYKVEVNKIKKLHDTDHYIYKLENIYPKLRDDNYKDFSIQSKYEGYADTIIYKHKLIKYENITKYEALNTGNSNYQLARINRYLLLNYKQAITYYERAHSLGHINSAFELAEFYNYEMNDIQNSIKWYKKAHLIGNKQASFNLALFYDFKLYAYTNAIDWYKKAFKLGHKSSSTNISLIYKDNIKNSQKYLIWKGN